MAGPRLLDTEITTKSTTAPSGSVCCTPGQGLAHSPENRRARDAREGARGAGRVVVEVAGGITVYTARGDR